MKIHSGFDDEPKLKSAVLLSALVILAVQQIF